MHELISFYHYYYYYQAKKLKKKTESDITHYREKQLCGNNITVTDQLQKNSCLQSNLFKCA